MFPATGPTLSPCIGLCTLRGDGLCRGCLRALEEIAAWPQMGVSRIDYGHEVWLISNVALDTFNDYPGNLFLHLSRPSSKMTEFALQKLQPEYKYIHSKIQDKFKRQERLRGQQLA